MAEMLPGLSQALVETIEKAGQSIVRVEARKRLPATGIVWSADGLIVTSHHVVTRDDNIQVGLPDGSLVKAALVGRDPTTDIALLRADASGLTPAVWASPDAVKVGYLVLAAGRPGRSVQATLGIVSALNGEWRTPAGGRIDRYLQTDVTMYPGFSGGPLIGADGVFAGMNTSALLREASISIPSTTLARITGLLVEHGRVRRGYLGVSAQPVRLPESLQKSLEQETGLLIVSVEEGSPAERAGLLLGDTIIAIGTTTTRHMDHLLGALSDSDLVGKETPVKIVRSGELKEIVAMIGERES